MQRRSKSSSPGSVAALLSAGVILSSGAGATAQSPKAPQAGPKAPAAPAPPAFGAAPASRSSLSAGSTHIKFAEKFHKDRPNLTVAGMLNGRPVFKNERGEYFQVEPSTGDLTFHTAASLGYIKITDATSRVASPGAGHFIKFSGIKMDERCSVLGVDAQGHVLQQNSRGDTFYLSPSGDMVFVR